MNITNESPNATEIEVNKVYDCELCNDTGIIHFEESDGEGHYADTGVKKCVCKNETDY